MKEKIGITIFCLLILLMLALLVLTFLYPVVFATGVIMFIAIVWMTRNA